MIPLSRLLQTQNHANFISTRSDRLKSRTHCRTQKLAVSSERSWDQQNSQKTCKIPQKHRKKRARSAPGATPTAKNRNKFLSPRLNSPFSALNSSKNRQIVTIKVEAQIKTEPCQREATWRVRSCKNFALCFSFALPSHNTQFFWVSFFVADSRDCATTKSVFPLSAPTLYRIGEIPRAINVIDDLRIGERCENIFKALATWFVLGNIFNSFAIVLTRFKFRVFVFFSGLSRKFSAVKRSTEPRNSSKSSSAPLSEEENVASHPKNNWNFPDVRLEKLRNAEEKNIWKIFQVNHFCWKL